MSYRKPEPPESSPRSVTTDLAMRVAAGDRDAVAELYTRYLEAIRPFVRKKLAPPARDHDDDIDDVVQDGFVVALRALQSGRFDPAKGSFFSWLRTVIVNDIVDWSRKCRRRGIVLDPDLDRAPGPGADVGVATRFVMREEEARIIAKVRQVLVKLHDRYLAVLVARDILELDPREAATELGWSYRQGIDVYSRARSAIDKLLPGGALDWQVFLDWIGRTAQGLSADQVEALLRSARGE